LRVDPRLFAVLIGGRAMADRIGADGWIRRAVSRRNETARRFPRHERSLVLPGFGLPCSVMAPHLETIPVAELKKSTQVTQWTV